MACRYRGYPYNSKVYKYLPQVHLNAHATILSSTSRTILTQTFVNPTNAGIKELSYVFPLYDGVSVVGFTCHVGDRVLQGEVKAKETANAEYREAVDSGMAAGILDHSESSSDVFQIRLGNVPADSKVVVEITIVQELRQDAQTDGTRYTLPYTVAPRYGCNPDWGVMPPFVRPAQRGVSVTVDVAVDKGSVIRGIDSPSHPIKILLGRTSLASESTFEPHQASASLHLAIDQASLDRDFVVIVNADEQDKPYALLETHTSIPNQRALMTSLVPKFDIPSSNPEIVFVIDRSGSMRGKIPTLRSALKVFLKSLPLGVHFNICSFGSHYEFLWAESQPYSKSSLDHANRLADSLESNFGGTEMQSAIEATVSKRLGDKDLEVLMLTDGEIWNQQQLFSFVTEAASKNEVRFFTLGIGDAASHALIEGVARAGNGFSQPVLNYEELDRKIVRMLKGALTPRIHDCTLEVEYDAQDHDFEMVDSSNEPVSVQTKEETPKSTLPDAPKQPISLYDSEYKEPTITIKSVEETDLPSIPLPAQIQAPTKIPNLYPFIRSTAYVLLDPQEDRIPRSVVLKATSKYGPLVLNIPIHDIGQGEAIHQLASRKAVIELEEGHGWMEDHIKDLGRSKRLGIIARECQRLGTWFQVTGKHCSFVAVDQTSTSPKQEKQESTCDILAAASADVRQSSYGSQLFGASGHSGFGCSSGPAYACASASLARSSGPALFGSSGEGPRGGNGGSASLFGSSSTGGAPSRSLGLGSRSAQPQNMQVVKGAFARGNTQDLGGVSKPAGSFTEMHKRKSSSSRVWGNARFMSTRDDDDDDTPKSNSFNIPAPAVISFDGPADKTSGKFHAVIALQSFEGYWKWSQELLNILDLKEPDVKAKLSNKLQDHAILGDDFALEDRGTFLATLLVMSFLEKKCADSRATWDLVLAKAETWVQSRSQTNADVLDKYKVAVNTNTFFD